MARPPSKDVSVGEYDPITGLTHITHQRGRLLFNMGASVKKRRRLEQPGEAPAAVKLPPLPTTTTGTFTGLSLYPEEANYLLQRGALTIYLVAAKGVDAKELSVAEFAALLARDTRVSAACTEVYSFLKDQKLHPRRCLEPAADAASEDGRSVPRHFVQGEPCDVAFDVWKTVTVDVESPAAQHDEGADAEQTGKVSTNIAKPKKHQRRKKLKLVFRVVVCCFGDAAPGPRSLRQASKRSESRDRGDNFVAATGNTSLAWAATPVKLAVVHHDQSVLLFEISCSLPAVPKQLQHEQAKQAGA
ncbi:unnamed protein product [Phytophthora lilii]|uniref:Unnamed protein product n=1 Tax=Phytophthora lilii TaxID=2077276 RepID=A0A9W6TKK0_9STRA|nr:unnamed protein product [Phytophthora lilii]